MNSFKTNLVPVQIFKVMLIGYSDYTYNTVLETHASFFFFEMLIRTLKMKVGPQQN